MNLPERIRDKSAAAAVQAAVDAGAQVLGGKGLLVCKVIIPAPRRELLTEMV